ncbi:MAG TPA: hypothetical protein PKE06_04280 [Flavilitoribacter sp.]|nr:hypothetical protein [Flavilitoribacter sp.]HMQ87196.1 hypothetical protein [Flavilitoribacter sp.]
MIKHLILLVVTVGMTVAATAQTEMPVVLVAAKGKIKYTSADGMTGKILTGAVLRRGGSLQLKKKNQVVLFHNGHFRQLEGKQSVPLASQFPEGENMVDLDFALTFGTYVMAAVDLAANSNNSDDAWGTVKSTGGSGDGWGTVKSTGGSGDGWGTVKPTGSSGDGWGTVKPTGGSGDGFGDKGLTIWAIQPFGKVNGKEPVRLYWSKPSGNPEFYIRIQDEAGQTVKETTTRDTSWTLEPIAAGLKEGAFYQWNVSVKGAADQKSNTLTFEMGSPNETAEVMKRVENSAIYKRGPESLRGLMSAIALEQKDWYHAAAEVYDKIQKNHPKDQMVRLMHAAFWVRYGLKPEGEKAFARTK